MKFLRWSFLLFVISVYVSQSAMDLFSVLFCMGWIGVVWNSRKGPIKIPLLHSMKLEPIWIYWFIVVLIGFILHPLDLGYAARRLIEFKWILILYVMIEVLAVLKPSRQSLNFVLGLLFFVGSTNLLLYYLDLPALTDFRYGSTPGGFLRAGGFFANPMTFAHSFVLFFCFMLGLFLIDRKNWSRGQVLFALFNLLIAALGLYLTFTRGVWIGLFLSIVTVFLFWKPKYSLAALLMFSILLAGLYKGSADFKWRLDRTVGEAKGESERKILWKTHFLIFSENPIFGLGYGQNSRELRKYYDRLNVPQGTLESHAHNEYLHLAAGTGILGLFAYLAIWAFFFLQLIRLWLNRQLENWDRGVVFGFLMAQTAFVIGSLTESNFEHSKVRFAVMLIWAYTVYLAKKYSALGWRAKGDL